MPHGFIKMLRVFAFISFASVMQISCDSSISGKVSNDFILKPSILQKNAHYYNDFDIFGRKGVDEIIGDTLRFPFFEYFAISDTTFQLNLHRNDKYGLRVEKMIVPIGEQTIYTFHDISDGPRYYFAKIVGDTIIRYNYTSYNPKDFNEIPDDTVMYYEIIPDDIEFIYNDTCYSFFWGDCYFHEDIKNTGENSEEQGINTSIAQKDILKYAVMPFKAEIASNCGASRVYYFDKAGILWHYNKDDLPNEYGGKNDPVQGLYGYEKEFKFWNDFHNLGRMN